MKICIDKRLLKSIINESDDFKKFQEFYEEMFNNKINIFSYTGVPENNEKLTANSKVFYINTNIIINEFNIKNKNIYYDPENLHNENGNINIEKNENNILSLINENIIKRLKEKERIIKNLVKYNVNIKILRLLLEKNGNFEEFKINYEKFMEMDLTQFLKEILKCKNEEINFVKKNKIYKNSFNNLNKEKLKNILSNNNKDLIDYLHNIINIIKNQNLNINSLLEYNTNKKLLNILLQKSINFTDFRNNYNKYMNSNNSSINTNVKMYKYLKNSLKLSNNVIQELYQ